MSRGVQEDDIETPEEEKQLRLMAATVQAILLFIMGSVFTYVVITGYIFDSMFSATVRLFSVGGIFICFPLGIFHIILLYRYLKRNEP